MPSQNDGPNTIDDDAGVSGCQCSNGRARSRRPLPFKTVCVTIGKIPNSAELPGPRRPALPLKTRRNRGLLMSSRQRAGRGCGMLFVSFTCGEFVNVRSFWLVRPRISGLERRSAFLVSAFSLQPSESARKQSSYHLTLLRELRFLSASSVFHPFANIAVTITTSLGRDEF